MNVAFFRKIARETQEDGWVYTFKYEDFKDENADDSHLIKYAFFGINLRYRYDEDYIQKVVRNDSSKPIIEVIYPTLLIRGGASEKESEEIEYINSVLLDSKKSVEELLAMNPDDYEFETLDKNILFRLMRQALTGEPQKEGSDIQYWNLPSYAMLVEPDYSKGYKFQIAFLNGTGCVDELYIDVLYKTGDRYADYVQLSDLVANNSATEEQREAFERIQAIEKDIKEQENFTAYASEYKKGKIGEIDFKRLYKFLKDIHQNDFLRYIQDPYTEILEDGDDRL